MAAPRPALSAVAVAAAFTVTLGFALAIDIYRGFANRTPEIAKQVANYKVAAMDWDFPLDCNGLDGMGNLRPCSLGPPDGHETLILGDSFSIQIYHRLEAEKAILRGPVKFLTSVFCPPVTGVRFLRDRLGCNGFFEKAFDYAARENPARIVLASNWPAYFRRDNEDICFIDGQSCAMKVKDPAWFAPRVEATFAALGEMLRKFKARGTEVVLLAATPYDELNVPSELLKGQFLGLDLASIVSFDRDKFESGEALIQRNLAAVSTKVGATLIEPADFLCDARRCPTVDGDGVSYFFDAVHYRAGAVRTDRFAFYDSAVGLSREFGDFASR